MPKVLSGNISGPTLVRRTRITFLATFCSGSRIQKLRSAEYTEAARYGLPARSIWRSLAATTCLMEDYAAAGQVAYQVRGAESRECGGTVFPGTRQVQREALRRGRSGLHGVPETGSEQYQSCRQPRPVLRRTGQDRGRTGGLPQSHCAGRALATILGRTSISALCLSRISAQARPSYTSLKRFRSPLAIPEGTGSWEKAICS